MDGSEGDWTEGRFATPLPMAWELPEASCKAARSWKFFRGGASFRGRVGCMALGRSIGSLILDIGSLFRFDQGILNDCTGTRIAPDHRRSRGSGSRSEESLLGLALELRRRLRRPWPLPALDFEFGIRAGSFCARAPLARQRNPRSTVRIVRRRVQRAIMSIDPVVELGIWT